MLKKPVLVLLLFQVCYCLPETCLLITRLLDRNNVFIRQKGKNTKLTVNFYQKFPNLLIVDKEDK